MNLKSGKMNKRYNRGNGLLNADEGDRRNLSKGEPLSAGG